jgi:hypothetical protein
MQSRLRRDIWPERIGQCELQHSIDLLFVWETQIRKYCYAGVGAT